MASLIRLIRHVSLFKQDKAKESSELTIGKALLDIVGQKYGEGDEAGEITMVNVMETCADVIAAGTYTLILMFDGRAIPNRPSSYKYKHASSTMPSK